MKKIFLFSLCSFLFLLSSFAQCDNLPSKFSSYSQAIRTIQSTSFDMTEKLPNRESSWIAGANFYSCNYSNGYLILRTNSGKSYIHEKVPIYIWRSFKNASSFGSYYDYNIKNNYRLNLKY